MDDKFVVVMRTALEVAFEQAISEGKQMAIVARDTEDNKRFFESMCNAFFWFGMAAMSAGINAIEEESEDEPLAPPREVLDEIGQMIFDVNLGEEKPDDGTEGDNV